MRIRPPAGALVTGLALVLAATLGAGTSAGAAGDDPRAQVSPASAKQALTAARAALAGTGGPSRDFTFVLRDLLLERDNLTGADRRAADAILNRPTDPDDPGGDYYGIGTPVETSCGDFVCVHWTEEAGNENAATPAYAAQVLATMDEIHGTFVDAGYKAPLPDDGQGGNTLPDVYLAEIGDYAYGYCNTDEPRDPDQYAVYTFCVLDDDYAEFGDANTPLDFMRVTAAHEYFHAVQGAYDWFEDRWLMEGSATWVEDEVYDHINDSRNYLLAGQLGDPANQPAGYGPRIPLDELNQAGSSMYGNWVFFRHLTENLPDAEGGIPVLMRTIWEHADSTNGVANDEYSLQAVASALDEAGTPFWAAYTSFAVANRQPRVFYEEGVELAYPTPGLAKKAVTLTPGKPRTSWGSVKQDHLTNDTVRFKPGKKMKGAWKLKVQVDMAPENRGSVAMLTVFFKEGEAGIKQVPLNGQGDGSTKVPFAKADVRHVELTMINASERTNCWVDEDGYPYHSCFGNPLDDNLNAKFRGVASK